MLRTAGVVAGAATFVMALGGTASAAEPLDTVKKTVAGVALPGDSGGGGVVLPAAGVRSAVVGYIRISQQGDVSSPLSSVTASPSTAGTTWVASGALSDPNQWTCSGSGDTATFTVTCLPVTLPVDVTYTCDVLHADIYTLTAGSAGRTSMDCNGDGAPEAQTGYRSGAGGRDFVWALSKAPVTAFSCTLDLAVPNVTGGCGDPGTVGVE